ncbi:class I SAM-dependent methyltransferase [Halomicrococcus gelatinilyticus]|uniref:class I SAM-dependent methyltransferase n=1 Tax=Halomicrococcus gelatinilyticus TaxID=1702103 RepID=UPI002E13D524
MSHAGPSAAQRFYGRWARLYDVLASATPGLARLRDLAVDRLDLAPGDTVVEMGCGTGANFPHLRDRVGPSGTVVGVDFTREMLAQARDRVRREGWTNVHLVQADAASFAPREPVDAVLATFVVGMLDDPAAAVDGWVDSLRPGGHLALLDAAQSGRASAWPVDVAFRGLVLASTPGDRSGFDDPPWQVLDERVAAARAALAERAVDVADSEHVLGVVRVTGGRVP